jgi:hypothetical protein
MVLATQLQEDTDKQKVEPITNMAIDKRKRTLGQNFLVFMKPATRHHSIHIPRIRSDVTIQISNFVQASIHALSHERQSYGQRYSTPGRAL